MKKRLLAMLLALMLVVSLLPVGVLADGQIYEGNETFSYHITDSSLQAMVDAYNTTGATSDVSSVSITFDEPYTLGGQSTFLFRNGNTIDFSNTSDAVQPDDISHLTITLESGASLTVPGDALDWTWVSSLPRRYDLSLDAGDGNCTVTFYVQNGDSFDNSSWKVYQTRTVPVGSTLGDNMPALPTQEDPDAHWIAWEIGDNDGDGRELHADTVITGDMSVYARKTLPSSGGEEIRVMGPENDFIEILKEKFEADSIVITGISAFGGGEETNPNYDSVVGEPVGPTANGWKNNGEYYRVMNESLPGVEGFVTTNNRVRPGELEGIKIYATVDGTEETLALYRNDLDVRVTDSQKIFEIYLREATEPDTPVEPEIPDEPTTDPDVSGVGIVVDCTANDAHASETLDVIDNTYDFHKAWDGDQWTCTVVIDPDDYVDTYNEAVSGHALNPANQTGELLYVYSNGSWEYVGEGSPTVTFTVACSSTDPDPEEPPAPTGADLSKLAVVLECVNEDVEHMGDPKTFNLRTTNCTYDIKQVNGQYICTVTPNYDLILERYNEQVAGGHTYADDAEKTLMLTWDGKNKTWIVAGDVASITRLVMCPPKAPTADEVNELIDVYVDCITPGTSHDWTFVDLDEAGYKVGTVELKDGQYYCNVTFDAKYFVDEFGTKDGRGPHITNDVDATVTFVYDNGWKLADGETSQVKFTAECEPIVYTIHVSFVGPNGEAYGGGDVISTAPNDSVAIADPVAEGMEFVGWKKLVGLEEIYEGDFTYTALAELVGDSFTPDTHETWLKFEAVFEPIVYTIHVSFVGPNGEAYGGGDVISTAPNDSVAIADPVAEGMEFVGWKKLVGLEEIYTGEFTYTALAELVGDSFTPDTHETWLKFEAVFEPIVYTIHVSFVGPNGEAYGGGDVISTAPNDSVAIADPVAEGMEFVGWKKLVGLEEIYEGDFTYTALAELVGDSFTPDTHETWLTFEAVFEPIVYTIHVSFVGPNGEAYGGGDVISTMPDGTVKIADPVAEGMEFVGWKKLVGLEEIYTGDFTYTALAALVGDNFAPDTHETWLTFEAVFEDETVEPDPYYTIHVSFVGPNGEAYGGGDVISTMPDVSVEIADPVAEGKTFVGWKKLVGLEEIYNGEFTYTALAALVGDNFTPDTHETWLEFEAVFEDEIIEPDPYYIINIRFVDSDGTTSLGGGDVISTSPDAAYPSVPSPVAPQGMEFAGWKVWLGSEPMYEGEFTFNALKALKEELDGEITWDDGRTWITFQAVYEDVTVEPDPGVTGFTKTLVTDRDLYNARGIAYPDFYRGTVIVDEGDRVTLIYNITVKGTAGTEFTVRDDSADFAQTGVIPSSGETSFYVAKTFSWRDVRNAGDTLDNTASVSVDGETVKTDTERVPVDIDWDINVPDIDDDDDDDVAEPDDEYIPNWLNTTDHYSYIVGYEDGTIRPGNNITRAEVATIFYRLLSEGSSERWYSASNSFSDVAADSWYNVPVSTLSNMGIIDGYEDGTFKPNAPITRAEFTAIATRFFDYTAEYEGAFNDVTYSDWYADCVQAAVDMGLVNGYADGGFHPNAYITRAESCAIVNRVLNRVPHEDHLLDEDEMITWPDNSYGAWYYADMQEATNSHDYDWISVSGEVVEEWTDKLAEPNW